MQSVVVFELNEVPWRILDWWVDQRPDGGIAELLARSTTWTTICSDEGHLSPWITWPTVHRGVPNTEHGIAHFGQDTSQADDRHPTWWATAAAAGRRVGVFGLLHTNELPEHVDRYAFFVPDAFAPTAAAHPATLEPFQAFNLAMSRASARNVDTGIDRATASAFLRRAPLVGLRPSTVARLVRQLVDERRRPHTRVRRRSFQSVIGFDLFMAQVRRTRPDAAAYFTNHVASAMHRYWAATFPEDYPTAEYGFDSSWIETWKGEIAEAMSHADRMVGRLLAHCESTGSRLVVLSSMGQHAFVSTPVRRQLYLRDLERFATAAGVPGDVERRPAMDPHVSGFVSSESRETLRAFVASVRIGGAPIVAEFGDDGFFSLEFGQADDAIGDVTVGGRVTDPSELGLEVVDIEDEVASTGYHVPEGSLAIFDPRRAPSHTDRPIVETTAIAPTLLKLLGLEPAPHHGAGLVSDGVGG